MAAQVVLLLTLVLLPSGALWPVPPWMSVVWWALVVIGVVVVVVAGLNLGRALTPTPVPNGRAELQTGGLYRWVRHPIYTGVLSIVVGLMLSARSWAGLAVGLTTVVFFHVKARWEEARLVETFDGYRDYAAATPRFVPFWPAGLVRGTPPRGPSKGGP